MHVLPEPVIADAAAMSHWLRDGDRILVGQGSGEPGVLMDLLGEAARERHRLVAIIGMTLGALPGVQNGLRYESYGALGTAARLPETALTVVSLHYSDFVARIVDGRTLCDVVFVQLSQPDEHGALYLGMGDVHLIDAARRARVVIAEINNHTPRTCGTRWPTDIPVQMAIETDQTPPSPNAGEESKANGLIASHIADLVPDKAVIQLGIGRLPDSIAHGLRLHRDLGLHSGVISDGVLELATCGALTNACKEVDAGISVGGVVVGGPRLFAHMRNNPSIEIRPASNTHSPIALSKLSRFTALNSAVEVDLTGQINTEIAAGRRIGGAGGQVDFTRAARVSPGGRAIVALPSTTRKGSLSRIVPSVARVTVARTDADTVVTEWGVAELAGQPANERAKRLIAIASPDFQEDLSRYWHEEGRQNHA